MQITDVDIQLENSGNESLRGFASLVFDRSFVVRDLRIIQAKKRLILAMPSKELRSPSECGHRNRRSANFCSTCGQRLQPSNAAEDGARGKFHDVAHPINGDYREYLESHVFAAYQRLTRSPLPITTTDLNLPNTTDPSCS